LWGLALFYNSNGGWDWEEGELEELMNSNAVDLDKWYEQAMKGDD